MDAADCVPLSAGPIAGAAACPHAGVAAAAANVTDRRKTRCLSMTIPFVFARDALPRPFGHVTAGAGSGSKVARRFYKVHRT